MLSIASALPAFSAPLRTMAPTRSVAPVMETQKDLEVLAEQQRIPMGVCSTTTTNEVVAQARSTETHARSRTQA
jgi:hypothetical protein